MAIITRDGIFARFLEILTKVYKRDLSQYHFEMNTYFEHPILYPLLERYLAHLQIEYFKKGLSIDMSGELPVSVMLRDDKRLLPYGNYVIYPGTNNEIILFFYEFLRGALHYIVCYKDKDIFENLLEGYEVYRKNYYRSKEKMIVFGGKDIDCPDIGWDEIILPCTLRDDIRRHLEAFINGEEAYGRLAVPYKRGFLFAGPPGNGKTMIMKAIASNFRTWQFIYFKDNPQLDNSDVDGVFNEASRLAPSIICFEDLDSLFNREITLSHFLNKLDGFEERNGILVLATTNHPEYIDPALTSRPSRFDRVWVIGNPELDQRRTFLEKYFSRYVSSDCLDNVAENTEGFSMAFLKELYISASVQAIHNGMDAPGERDLVEVLESLSSQVAQSKKQFVGNVRAMGFL